MPANLDAPISDPGLRASDRHGCGALSESGAADDRSADAAGAPRARFARRYRGGPALEDALGVEIPPELMTECLDVRSLAAAILERRGTPATPDDRLRSLARMRADAVLPEDIRPATSRTTANNWKGLSSARRVLVTGSTGFLGSRLVADLLANSTGELLCLIRPSASSPEERLRVALRQWSVDFDRHARRVPRHRRRFVATASGSEPVDVSSTQRGCRRYPPRRCVGQLGRLVRLSARR